MNISHLQVRANIAFLSIVITVSSFHVVEAAETEKQDAPKPRMAQWRKAGADPARRSESNSDEKQERSKARMFKWRKTGADDSTSGSAKNTKAKKVKAEKRGLPIVRKITHRKKERGESESETTSSTEDAQDSGGKARALRWKKSE